MSNQASIKITLKQVKNVKPAPIIITFNMLGLKIATYMSVDQFLIDVDWMVFDTVGHVKNKQEKYFTFKKIICLTKKLKLFLPQKLHLTRKRFQTFFRKV
jgi:hypothetical protein